MSVAPVVKFLSVCWSPFSERRDPTEMLGAEQRSLRNGRRGARRSNTILASSAFSVLRGDYSTRFTASKSLRLLNSGNTRVERIQHTESNGSSSVKFITDLVDRSRSLVQWIIVRFLFVKWVGIFVSEWMEYSLVVPLPWRRFSSGSQWLPNR